MHFTYASDDKLLMKVTNNTDLDWFLRFAMHNQLMNGAFHFSTLSGGYFVTGFSDDQSDNIQFRRVITALTMATRAYAFMYISPIITSVWEPAPDCKHQIQTAKITSGGDDMIHLGELFIEEKKVKFRILEVGTYDTFDQADFLSFPEIKSSLKVEDNNLIEGSRNTLDKFAPDIKWDWPSFDVTMN